MDELQLSDLSLPPYPRIRWWWPRWRKELAKMRHAREWQAALWEQTQGRPVHLATIREN